MADLEKVVTVVKQFFPNLTFLSADQWKSATKEQVSGFLVQYREAAEVTDKKLIQTQTQLETCEAQKKTLHAEAKEKFKVSSREELQGIREKLLGEIGTLSEQIKSKMES